MKHLLFLLMVFSPTVVPAQDFYGIAEYESIFVNKGTTVSVKDDPAMEARLNERLSKPMNKHFTLTFSRTESLFEEEASLSSPTGGMPATGSMIHGDIYKNIKDKVVITEMEIMGKEFLVTDSLVLNDWKLENETKQIGSYTCYKATYTIKAPPHEVKEEEKKEDSRVSITSAFTGKDIVVTAWYTPQIPVNQGPGGYWGLPGLILEVSNGRTTVLCSKLVLNPKKKPEIKLPSRGEKVNREEFTEIMKERTEQIKAMSRRPGSRN